MSRSILHALWLGERHEELREFRNSHGTSPNVWNSLARRYLGWDKSVIAYHYSEFDRVGELRLHLGVPLHSRAVLCFCTYDLAYIAKADYRRFAADIPASLAEHPFPPDHVNHWPEIAAIFESDPDIPAINLQPTSVCSNPWNGPWDEEKDEPGLTPWDQAWNIYEALPVCAESVEDSPK